MENPKLPRYIPTSPYDPIQRAKLIERKISQDDSRLYSCFSLSPNWGGSNKAYAIGCNLMCSFCWSPCRTIHEISEFCASRATIAQIIRKIFEPHFRKSGISIDEVLDLNRALSEISAYLLNPKEVIQRMNTTAEEKAVTGIGSFELITEGSKPNTIKYYTLTGGEPSLCRSHLLGVVENFCEQNRPEKFLLQSNGFVFGSDPSYLKALFPFKNFIEVRISLKAGTPEGLLSRTGVTPKSFDLPYKAIQDLLEFGFDFQIAAMSDPEVMPQSERDALLDKINGICESHGKKLYLMRDLLESQPEDGYVDIAGINDGVFLDEEKYVPFFPQILSASLNTNCIS